MTPYEKSVFVLKNESEGENSRLWTSLNFVLSDSVKLTLMNYKSNQGQYLPSIDLSIDMFWEKSRLIKIQDYLSNLKNQNLALIVEGEEIVNPKIEVINFDFNVLNFKLTNNNKLYNFAFNGVYDPTFQYDEGWPDRRAKLIFNLPIYKIQFTKMHSLISLEISKWKIYY